MATKRAAKKRSARKARADDIGGNAQAKSIRAKKRASGVDAIRKKAAAGEPHAERAYVRVGKSNTAILAGTEDLSEWTEEELIRGQRKDKNGRFQGRPPKIVPKPIHDELVRRTLHEGKELLRTALVPALETLSTVLDDPEAKDQDKIKAAGMILDRMLGKPTEHVHVSGDGEQPAFIGAIVNALVPVEQVDDEGDIIDAEEVDPDDD